MRQHKISVAMATYNGHEYLPAQLNSLASQELLPDELVVTDDGSTDGTAELVARFAESAPFEVRFYRNETRLGVVRNFERAISLCTGDILFLSDQDDFWLPSKIKDVVARFDERPEALAVINDKIIVNHDLSATGATMLGNIRAFGSPDSCFVAGCCSAFRRQWLSIALPIPEGQSAHDSWLMGLAHRLGVVRIEESALQYYRRHESNVSQNAYSDSRRIGFRDRLKAELSSSTRRADGDSDAYWRDYLAGPRAELERIELRRPELEALGLGDRALAAAAAIRETIMAASERQRLAHLPPPGRLVAAWKLWRRGGYRHFSGWKSAAKDVLGG
jgi:glycosyltransferase involved in cell wall biosynthesis